MPHAGKNRTYFHYEHEALKVKSQARFILLLLPGRTHRLGTALVEKWSRIPQDTSAPVREAEPAVAPPQLTRVQG
jgi:hypothetical protein